MTVDELVRLIEALAKLAGVLALVGFVLLCFGPALRGFFESLGEFSLKGAGFEATARRRGALGATNRPGELFEYVLAALRAAQ